MKNNKEYEFELPELKLPWWVVAFENFNKALQFFFVVFAVIGFYYFLLTGKIDLRVGAFMMLGINWMALNYFWDFMYMGGYFGGKRQGFKEGVEMSMEAMGFVLKQHEK